MSAWRPLVFILPIAISLVAILFVAGPREVIAAVAHTVSHGHSPVQSSNSLSRWCHKKRCPSPDPTRSVKVTNTPTPYDPPTTAAPIQTPTFTPTPTSTSTLTPASCTTSAASGSCGPYTYPQISGINGTVTVGNNVWSPISGWSETLNADNPGDWSVTANMPVGNTSVVSYPNVGTTVPWLPGKDVNPNLSSWSSMYSSWNVNIAGDANSGSVGEAGYDIWLNNWNNEVMIQTDFVGDSLRPRCDVNGDVIATASFGGSNGVPVQSWNLCQFGSELIWQLPTGTNDPSGSVDIMAMLTWLEDHGNGKYLPRQLHAHCCRLRLRDLLHRQAERDVPAQRFHADRNTQLTGGTQESSQRSWVYALKRLAAHNLEQQDCRLTSIGALLADAREDLPGHKGRDQQRRGHGEMEEIR